MKDYPQTIPAFRGALLAYSAPEGAAYGDAIVSAQSHASPVVQAVGVFDALKDEDNLSTEANQLLAGAAHLIAQGGWHGKAGDAVTTIVTVTPLLPDLPEPPAAES